jgi:hypothetical protein
VTVPSRVLPPFERIVRVIGIAFYPTNLRAANFATESEFVRDPVMLEFLGLPGTGKLLEADLEQALLE